MPEYIKELRHSVQLRPEDEGLLTSDEITAFYAHSLVYPKKESGMVESSLSGSSMEPRFAVGHPVLRKIAAKVIKKRIETFDIRQVAVPGIGGLLTALAWAETGAAINIAHLRVDAVGKQEKPVHKRLDTSIEGFLSKEHPVWISDDVLTTGNGFIKAFSCLLNAGFTVGGFCPLMAHEENSGVRGSQCITMHNSNFSFAPVFMLTSVSKNLRAVTKFSSANNALFP